MSRRVTPLVLLLLWAALTVPSTSSATDRGAKPWLHVAVVQHADGTTTQIPVELSAAPRSLLRSDGASVLGFSPEDGLRIAQAFEDAGITDERLLAKHLLATTSPRNQVPHAKADQANRNDPILISCPLSLEIVHSDGTSETLQIPLEGGYEPHLIDTSNPQRLLQFRRFSVEDALRIRSALYSAGFGDKEVIEVWLGLTIAPSDPHRRAHAEGIGPWQAVYAQVTIEPLDPDCGECDYGKTCPSGTDCCVGTPIDCMKCKVCG